LKTPSRGIKAHQFVASKSLSEERWLAARREGVTATQVAKAAGGDGGFETVVREYREDFREADNDYMRFGREMEPVIAMALKERHGIMPNDWLISHAYHPHHMATPDGLSLDHQMIAEIKTTGTEWKTIPAQYVRQVQWQLYVTGADLCVFAWMLRDEFDGLFIPAWFEPEIVLIDRDEEMIERLVKVADDVWERVNDVAY
jgi:putative phage-type endonuclease